MFYIDVQKWTWVKLDLFPCLARDWIESANEIHVRHKEISINRYTNIIPGETQDDLLRIAMDLPGFCQIPKVGHIIEYSKAESTVQCATLRYSTTQFVIHFVAFHYDYFGVLFQEGFIAKQQITPKKKEIITAL